MASGPIPTIDEFNAMTRRHDNECRIPYRPPAPPPVPFVGFRGFNTEREVTQVLDTYTLSAGGSPAYDGRKIMISAVCDQGDFSRVRSIFAAAPAERCVRILQTMHVPTAAQMLIDENALGLVDGILPDGMASSPEELLDVRAACPNLRILLRVSSRFSVDALGHGLDLGDMFDALDPYRHAVTDFVLEEYGRPFASPETVVPLIQRLYERYAATHGIVLDKTYGHASITDLAPTRASCPNMSLMMRLPVDKDGDGDDAEARYLLRNAFGMIFCRPR